MTIWPIAYHTSDLKNAICNDTKGHIIFSDISVLGSLGCAILPKISIDEKGNVSITEVSLLGFPEPLAYLAHISSRGDVH